MSESHADDPQSLLAALCEENRRLQAELVALRAHMESAADPSGEIGGREGGGTSAEEALRASEARFKRIFDQSPIGAAIVGLDQRFQRINAAYCRLLGYSEDELFGKTFRDITHPDDLGVGVEQVARLVAGEIDMYAAEKRYIRKDGRVIWARLSTCIVRDATGKPVCFLPMAEDIDDRRRAEDALKEKTDELERFFAVSLDLLCIASLDGVLIRINPAWEEALGYSIDELTGFQAIELIHPEDVEATKAQLGALAKGGQIPYFPIRCRRKDGGYRWIEWRAVPHGDRLFYAAGRDVTARLEEERHRARLEEQLRQSQKLESLGRLAGGVAHDFNNLLTCIVGNVSFLLPAIPAADPLHAPLVEIDQAAARAATLTRQLLAFSRKQVVEPRVLDLNQLVTQMNQMLARLIGEHIDYAAILQPALGHVRADPGQLEQVLVNLVVNARDAMPDGGRLTIETGRTVLRGGARRRPQGARPGEYVTLTVSDTGTGIAEGDLQYLFEPFYTTKPKGKGTGLGLATVYGAVQQAGGWIDVDSTPGRGSSFRVVLPRVDAPAEPRQRQPEPGVLPRGTETVALVEDDPVVRSFTERLLRSIGYQVLSYGDPSRALDELASFEGPIHVLLTDVVMPRLNGRALAERLATARPGLKVLFTSGYPDSAVTHNGEIDVGLSFIAKPYTASALAQKLRHVLEGSE